MIIEVPKKEGKEDYISTRIMGLSCVYVLTFGENDN
jgi:hypothetical protein